MTADRMIALLVLVLAAAGCSEDETSQPGGSGGGTRDAATPRASDAGASPQPDAAAAALPELCSGCEGEAREVGDNEAHFHHAHLNTHDLAESEDFYERVFGASKVRLNEQADVLKADGALVLLEEVSGEPSDALETGLEHIGWGSTDVGAFFQEAQTKDIVLDQRTAAFDAPFELFPGFFFFYVQGPSNERIEVNTEMHEEFGHVHFMTDDVDGTVAWYEGLLGVQATMEAATEVNLGMWGDIPLTWSSNNILIDKVNMVFFGPPCVCVPPSFEPSDDYPIGHIAFAFADLDPVIERAQTMGVEGVSEPAVDERYGFRSFFVRAPNAVLIELVEAGPVPNPWP